MKPGKSLAQFFWRQKKISTSYFLSLIFVFLIPFVILAVSFLVFSESIHQNNQQAVHAKTLDNATSELNDQLDHLLIAVQQIGMDTTISTDDAHIDTAIDLQSALARYQLSSSLIDKLLVFYYRDPAQLYSSDGTYDIDAALYKYGLANTEKMPGKFQTLYTDKPLVLAAKGEGLNGDLNILVPAAGSLGGAPYATIIFHLNGSTIQHMLDQSVGASDQLLVLAHDQQVLVSTDYGRLKLRDLAAGAAPVPLTQLTAAARKNGMQTTTASATGDFFTVTSIASKAHVAAVFGDFVGRYFWILILLGGIGFLCIHILERRQYQLIADIEKKFPAPATASAGLSEQEQLQRTITTYVQAHQTIEQQALQQLPFVREQVFQSLLTGRVGLPADLTTKLQLAQVSLPFRFFTVVLFPATTDETIDHIGQFVIHTNFAYYVTAPIGNNQRAIVLNHGERANSQALLSEIVTADDWQGVAAFYLGGTVDSIREIHTSFIQAASCLLTTEPTPNQKFYIFRHLPKKAMTPAFLDTADQLKLDTGMLNGNPQMALAAFEDIFAAVRTAFDPDMQFDLGSAMLITHILQADYQIHHRLNEPLLRNLLANESLADRHLILNQAVQDIAEAALSQEKRITANKDANLEQYIVSHAASPDFSLSEVADHFGLSLPHASRWVKDVTGQTFTAYLQQLRFDRIKEALVATDAPIKDIIEQSGYYDLANFTRKFRSVVGLPPGQYRTVMRQKGQDA